MNLKSIGRKIAYTTLAVATYATVYIATKPNQYETALGAEGIVQTDQTLSHFFYAEQPEGGNFKQFQQNVWKWNEYRGRITIDGDGNPTTIKPVWWRGDELMIRAGETLTGPDMNNDNVFGPNPGSIDSIVNK